MLRAANKAGRDVQRFARAFGRFCSGVLSGRLSRAPIVVCTGFSAFVLAWCVMAGMHFKNAVEQEFYRETQNIAQTLMAGFDDDAAAADAILTGLTAKLRDSDIAREHQDELHSFL